MKQRLKRLFTAAAGKWWLLTLAVLAFGLFMSQRPSRKNPSPADPGMWLAKEHLPTPKKGGAAYAESPIDDVPTNPKPQHPNAGAGPEDDDVDEEDKDDGRGSGIGLGNPTTIGHGAGVGQSNPFVSSWDLYKVAEGSDFGSQGDWVLVLNGFGFVDGEVPPMVHVGNSITLTNVFVNQRGSTLHALVPARIANSLDTAAWSEIAVQNPGGLNRDRDRWIKCAMNRDKLTEALKAAKPNKFLQGNYFLQKAE